MSVDSFRRSLPFIGAFSWLLLLSSATRFPSAWWVVTLGMVFVSFTLGLLLTTPQHRFSTIITTPAILGSLAAMLLLFFEADLSRQLLIVAVAGAGAFLWETLRRRTFEPTRYHDWQLENTFLLLNFVTIWVVAQLGFRFLLDPTILGQAFSAYAVPMIVLLVTSVALALDIRPLWLGEQTTARGTEFVIVLVLAIVELFWAINFLPAAPDVKAFFVAGCYYLLTNLGRAHLTHRLYPNVVRRYAYFFGAILLLVIASAEWFV